MMRSLLYRVEPRTVYLYAKLVLVLLTLTALWLTVAAPLLDLALDDS